MQQSLRYRLPPSGIRLPPPPSGGGFNESGKTQLEAKIEDRSNLIRLAYASHLLLGQKEKALIEIDKAFPWSKGEGFNKKDKPNKRLPLCNIANLL